jgi:molybdate transport system substrate-binding protein
MSITENRTMLRRSLIAWLCAPVLAIGARSAVAQGGKVTVFAAASLKNALDAVAADWRKQTGKAVTISYAASSTLAKQIENGAPADLFISADLDWMDYLQQRHLIDPKSRRDLLGNKLVLIAPKESTVQATLEPGFPLARLLDGGRLAMADPKTVPAGKYGKAALSYLGVWDAVSPRAAQAENVRAALALVAKGEAPLGIVYGTDAKSEPAVRVVGTFPEDSHPQILYPVALTASAKPEAVKFLEFLLSPEAAPSFESQGFTIEGKVG